MIAIALLFLPTSIALSFGHSPQLQQPSPIDLRQAQNHYFLEPQHLRYHNNEESGIFSELSAAIQTCAVATGFLFALAMPLDTANAIEPNIVESQVPVLNPAQRRYNNILATGTPEHIAAANEALLDHAVGTINTMYYDNSGGNNFDTKSMYARWGALRAYASGSDEGLERWKKAELRRIDRDRADWLEITDEPSVPPLERLPKEILSMPKDAFGSRENAIEGLNWIVSTLNDPYSKYLTKEQLFQELKETCDGFMGTGAMVEPPQRAPDNLKLTVDKPAQEGRNKPSFPSLKLRGRKVPTPLLKVSDVVNLPVVTAVAANSFAERDGIVVGDRIVSAGKESFLGVDVNEVSSRLDISQYASKSASSADIHRYPLAIAKPVVAFDVTSGQDRLLGYRVSRTNLQSLQAENSLEADVGGTSSSTAIKGGDGIVNYKLLMPTDSIFQRASLGDSGDSAFSETVGYIRLTRFSRASTAGYVKAVKELEAAGAQSFILDLRNNYGGIVQEAMLTASTLLRDPHSVLCYTLNSRGGFTPHDVEEYLVDKRFPGYLLSSEPTNVSIDQAKKENPVFFEEGPSSWSPPSAYISLREQGVKRNLHRTVAMHISDEDEVGMQDLVSLIRSERQETKRLGEKERESIHSQKKLAILINEGTASSAEVFAAALHDNGRAVALVGSRSYGKGLIQHTFPMPDGGGLRISVAEYLTPGLKHVTNVGSARYDVRTGNFFGGGIKPDIQCSSQGIPTDTGADICVGMAIDALDVAASMETYYEE